MGSDSLDSSVRLAHATSDFDTGPDLDDALVHQALSVYQAARDGRGGASTFPSRDLEIPIRVRDGKIEFEIDLPRDMRRTNCFPTNDSRHSRAFDPADIRDFNPDSDYAPSKPYSCSAHHREPRPIDERIVACSSRVHIEEVPIFGCSRRIKVEIDTPGFYLCSAHIRLKPDWTKDENPSEVNLCVSRLEPGEKRDWHACMQRLPIDGVERPKDYMLCVARIKHPLVPGDGFEPPRDDFMLCVAKIKQPLPHDLDQINACSTKFIPYVPREKAEDFVDRLKERRLTELEVPDEPIFGCGRKVPGEPGYYRMCSATARKDYIPEFLEYENQVREKLAKDLKEGRITQDEYDKTIKTWD